MAFAYCIGRKELSVARWRYRLTLYYGQDWGRSKKGSVALQSVHPDNESLNINLKAGKQRSEIGLITCLDLQTGGFAVLQHEHGR